MATWHYEGEEDLDLYLVFGEGELGMYSYEGLDGDVSLIIEEIDTDLYEYHLQADFHGLTPVINGNGDKPDFQYQSFSVSIVGEIPAYAFTPRDFTLPIPAEGEASFDLNMVDAYYNGRGGAVRDLQLDLNLYSYLPQINATQIYLDGGLREIANPEASSVLLLAAGLLALSWKKLRGFCQA